MQIFLLPWRGYGGEGGGSGELLWLGALGAMSLSLSFGLVMGAMMSMIEGTVEGRVRGRAGFGWEHF